MQILRAVVNDAIQGIIARVSYFFTEWVLSTNHRRIAVLYFFFVLLAGFTGLILATIIRLELAYPGQFFLTNNAERYLTTISLHGVVMVFFMIIPVIFGAFGNFLLPTQLGIRDVAFPRLNSFMFWVTPSGFVLLLHILLFDRTYNLTYWLNYGEVKAALRRRYTDPISKNDNTLFPHIPTEASWKILLKDSGLSNFEGTTLGTPVNNEAAIGSSYEGGIGSKLTLGPVFVPLTDDEKGKLYQWPTFMHEVAAMELMAEMNQNQTLEGAPSGSPISVADVRNLDVGSPIEFCLANPLAFSSIKVVIGEDYQIKFLPANFKFNGQRRLALSNVIDHQLSQDWRALKLERELWRSSDFLGQGLQTFWFRRRYYTNLMSPSTLVNKVSIWLPNNLIPGWAFITPYTSRLRYTAIGKVDIALIVVFMASLGSVFSAVNYVITYRYIGAPIFKGRRELRSFFIDGLLVGSRMMILANPALLIGIILLLSDRHFGTSVFDFSGGGDTILFQHLFWFFGHPEVYIIIIPCFGFMNSLLPYYLRKRLSGRLSLQFSMYTIAFMGFAVWGHHMYMVGLANSVRTLYSTMTVMISVPASTKVLHWCVTIIQSSPTLDVGFCFLLSFMYFFVLGGLSGMFNAHIGFDTMLHDTFYVIGHFHVMLAGAAMSCVFAGFYFYFPAIFGIRYSRFFAYLHFIFYLSGQLITLIPMFWLGYAGMPRRIMDYPAAFGGWHSLISSGHLLTVISFGFFLLMLADSFYENRAPVSKTRGVSRLNTRLAFYTYEIRKLAHWKQRSLILLRQPRNPSTAQILSDLETTAAEYVFSLDSEGSLDKKSKAAKKVK
jgi:heme/copper-type cytochrome/quinol oxidase subunit 1